MIMNAFALFKVSKGACENITNLTMNLIVKINKTELAFKICIKNNSAFSINKGVAGSALPGFTLAGDALRKKDVALLLPDVRPHP